jgi:hypothetical protein
MITYVVVIAPDKNVRHFYMLTFYYTAEMSSTNTGDRLDEHVNQTMCGRTRKNSSMLQYGRSERGSPSSSTCGAR